MKFILNFRLRLTTKYFVKKKKKYPEFCFFADIPMSDCNNWLTGTVHSDQMKFKLYDKKSEQSQNQRTLSIYVCLNVSRWLQALHTPLFGQLLLLAVIIGVGG